MKSCEIGGSGRDQMRRTWRDLRRGGGVDCGAIAWSFVSAGAEREGVVTTAKRMRSSVWGDVVMEAG
jgi:hypothetical protein